MVGRISNVNKVKQRQTKTEDKRSHEFARLLAKEEREIDERRAVLGVRKGRKGAV